MEALFGKLRTLHGRAVNGPSVAVGMMVFVVVVCVFIALIDGWRLWDARTTQLAETTTSTQNLAMTMARDATSAIDAADIDLESMVHWIGSQDANPAEFEHLNELLRALAAKSLQIIDLAYFDEKGDRLAGSLTVQQAGVNNADRDYFEFHKSNPDAGLHFAAPVIGRVSKKWVLPISRRMNGPDGRFAGVILATLDLTYFQHFYETLKIGNDGLAALMNLDGTILLRRPFEENLIGTRSANGSHFGAMLQNIRSGTVVRQSSTDKVERIISWQRLDPYPLAIFAGLSKPEALAAWRADAKANGVGVAAVILAIGFLGFRLSGQVGRVANAERVARAAMLEATSAEKQYRLLTEHSSDAILRLGLNGERLYVSPAARRILGYTEAEFAREKFGSFVHPEDLPRVFASFAELHEGRTALSSVTFRSLHKDGRHIWFEAVSQLLCDEAGAPRETVSSLRDVTQRKLAEDALHSSEERFRFLVDSVQDYGIYMLDVDGQVKSWNSGAERIKGYRADEIIGQNFSKFYTEGDRASGEPARALATALRQGVYSAEGWRVRKNGDRFWASVVVTTVRNREGLVIGFAKITRDLTERTIEEEQRQLIIEAAPNGMLIVDERGVITLANSAIEKIFGYEHGALLEMPIEALVPAPLRQDHVSLRTKFSADKDQRPMAVGRSLTGLRADGSEIPIEVMLSPVETPRGRIVVATVVDITARRSAEQALEDARDAAEEASRTKSSFLANMSHEIRSPMNAILGMLQLLLGTELTVRQRDYGRKAHSATESLLRLLNDILDFSRMEAGKVELDLQPFSIDAMMGDISGILSASLGEKAVELVFSIDPDLPVLVSGDEFRLRQVLLNLAGNALKFTQSGEVVVSVHRPDPSASNRIEFSVRDSGIGIAPEQLSAIFTEFSQAEASTTRRFGGTGLGLSISQRLVVLMGGKLEVESAVGRGSLFHFTVDLPAAEAVGDDNGWGVRAVSHPQHPLRVLIVDDHDLARDAILKIVQSLGWRADCAANGEDALAMVAHSFGGQGYDAVFIDWVMPGIGGWETARRMRAMLPAEEAPLITMVSAFGREELAIYMQAEPGVVNGFLVKPVTASMVFDAINETSTHRTTFDPRGNPQVVQRRLADLRLLVVEDNLINQQVAEELLIREGAWVEIAGDGRSGVDAALASDPPFDVVLMDLQMPGMDGYEATRLLRSHERGKALPILAMTANAMESDRVATAEAGMNAHIAKPIDLEALVAAILHHCGPRQRVHAPERGASIPAPVVARVEQGDLAVAMRRLGNNETLFAKIARAFVKETAVVMVDLEMSLKTGNAHKTLSILHTLKGQAGMLGLVALASFVRSLESQIKDRGCPSDAEDALRSLQSLVVEGNTELTAFAAGLDLAPQAASSGGAGKTLVAMLDELDVLLSGADMRAISVCSELQRQFGADRRESLAPLADAVDRLDFERARMETRDLRNSLQ